MNLPKARTKLNLTKWYYPPVPEDFVPRQRLQARLNLIEHRPLTLVSAPAGYGKTTTLSAWLKASELHSAWLSLDETDNDFTLFLLYFLAAIRHRVPAFAEELIAILDSGHALTPQRVIEYFYAEIDALDRGLILVLEDFHFIHHGEVLDLIKEFMRHPHPSFHLVLLSRHDPQLPLNGWRARNQVIDIRSADLRFALEETAAFLHAATDRTLDDAVSAAVHANTEGWVAGLRLAVLSLVYGKEDIGTYLMELSAHNQHILEFLADQVFVGLTPQQRAFLLQTSILNRLSGPLCEAVIDLPHTPIDALAMLRELNRENLFIVPLDGEPHWFRYHHLLAQFLQSRLAQEYSPVEVTQLHIRASRWYANLGYTEEAIRHAMLAGDMPEAVNVMAAARHDLLQMEHFGRLAALHNLFPDEVARSSPDLLLAKAWASHPLRYDIAEIGSLATEIDALLERLELDESRARLLRAENDILTAIALYFNLEPAAAATRCRRSLEILPRAYYTARTFARTYYAGALHMMGDLSGVHELAIQGQQEDLAVPGSPRGRNAAIDAFVQWMNGDLSAVRQAGEYVLSLTPSIDQHITKSWGHYFLAGVYYLQNNLVEARYHAESAFAARMTNRSFVAIYTGFILALVHQATGNPEKANDTMDQTLAYAIEVQSAPLIAVVRMFQVELDIRRGRMKQAAQWAEQILPTVRFTPWPFFYAPPLTVLRAFLATTPPARPDLLADYLRRLRTHLEATHNNRFLIEVLAMEAMFLAACDDEEAALVALNRSLDLAEHSNFIRVYVDLGPPLKDLLQRLYAQQPRNDYIQRILAAFPSNKPTPNEAMVEPLTDRELEVLNLLARRYSNKEIAQELFIAPVTVKRHTVNIYQKLNVGSRREAVQAAQRLRIID